MISKLDSKFKIIPIEQKGCKAGYFTSLFLFLVVFFAAVKNLALLETFLKEPHIAEKKINWNNLFLFQ